MRRPSPGRGAGISRRTALAALGLAALSPACGAPAPAAPLGLAERPYWEPALTVATGALDVLRSLELNARELGAGSQTAEQFIAAHTAQFETISTLGQAVIPLEPPPTAAAAHEHLTDAADALAGMVSTVRAYEEREEPELLVHVITLAQRARDALSAFVGAIGPGRASAGLQRIIDSLGEKRLEAVRVPMLAVLIGQFGDEADARTRIGRRLSRIRLSRAYPGWVEAERFAALDEAQAAARAWQTRGFETRIENVVELGFTLTDIRPPSAGRWTERAWRVRTDFEITDLAASEDGELIAAIARGGAIAAFGADGAPRWARDARIPLARVSVSSDGSLVAAHGFDLALLDADGGPVWQTPARPDNQLLEDVVFARGGGGMVARSTNASGVGHVFAFDRSGQLWGPTKDYIGAVDVALNPATGTVAVASSKLGENQIVLITAAGNLDQRFGVDGELQRVLFTQGGEHTIAVTAAGVQVFDSASGDLQWRLGYAAAAAARMPGANTLVLAGPDGVGAFTLDGTEIWKAPGLTGTVLLVTDNYVALQTAERTFMVLRSDGSPLGQLVTASPVRAAVAAPAADTLLTASADRAIEAWRLPEAAPAAG